MYMFVCARLIARVMRCIVLPYVALWGGRSGERAGSQQTFIICVLCCPCVCVLSCLAVVFVHNLTSSKRHRSEASNVATTTINTVCTISNNVHNMNHVFDFEW